MISHRVKTIYFILLLASLFSLIALKILSDERSGRLIDASLYFPVYLNNASFEINITGEDGSLVTEKNLQQGLYLLHFWATWCKSCEEELYKLNSLRDAGIRLLCISVDESIDVASQFLRERGINLPLYLDKDGENAKRLGTLKFPETYVVYDGRLILKFEGSRNWEDRSLINFVLNSVSSYSNSFTR
jgi:peroxiredoxin